jgi:hypothetical protein
VRNGQLFVVGEGHAGGLLAVAQRGVVDGQPLPRIRPWSMDSRRVPPSTRCTRSGTPAASQRRMSAMRGGFNGSTQRIHANDGKAGSALACVVAREARQFDHQRVPA